MKNLNELIENDEDRRNNKALTVGNIIDSFIDSVKYIWNSPLFRPFIFMMFCWNASALNPNTASMTYYFTWIQKYTELEYGLAVSFFNFFSFLGFICAQKVYQRFQFYKSFSIAALFLATISSVSLLFFNSPILFAIAFSISRFGGTILSFGTFVIRQTNIPRAKMGGINASLRMFFMSSTPLSALLQGFLIHNFGVGVSFGVGALCLFGTAWYAVHVARAFDKSRPQSQKQAA